MVKRVLTWCQVFRRRHLGRRVTAVTRLRWPTVKRGLASYNSIQSQYCCWFWIYPSRSPYQGTLYFPGPTQSVTGVAGVSKWSLWPPCDDPGALGACGVSANGGRKIVRFSSRHSARPHRYHRFFIEISSLWDAKKFKIHNAPLGSSKLQGLAALNIQGCQYPTLELHKGYRHSHFKNWNA